MNYIKINTLQKELYYDNTIVLKYKIDYPTIYYSNFENGVTNFNLYNKKLALELRNKVENELYQEAIETYKFNKENGYPIMVYEVYKNFEITLNAQNLISMYADEYTFTGGAHGNTIRTSQTWNLFYGNIIPLENFFYGNPYFVLNILKQINLQISENPEIYFENTCNLVIDTFDPKNYYLTPHAIIIYFQQYDIAPYSSGIRTFSITKPYI